MCRYIVIVPVLFVSGFPLTSAILTNFADVPCGQSVLGKQLRQGRIIGGMNASQGEFPWIVSLTRSGGHFCGGTLVNDRWVLTAAHCLCSGRDSLGTTSLRVTLGEHDLLVNADPQLPVSRVVLHPEFRCGSYNSDLALIKLGGSITWSSAILPACFPPVHSAAAAADYAEESSVTVAGWGWTNEVSSKGVRSNTLQKVQLSVVDNLTCKAWYKSQGKKLNIKDSQMCAGLESGGKDACWADSGGPLMMEEGQDTEIVGVVSTGIGCGRPRLPGVYTRVSQFMPWISATLKDTSS